MNEKASKIVKTLKYTNDFGLGFEWTDFLKSCNVNFYTSRKDQLWYSIRGKGYIIWISSQYPQQKEDTLFWLIDFEIAKTAPHAGIDYLNELIEAAIRTFDNMELMMEQ